MFNHPSPSPMLGKVPIGVIALAFDLCVLYYRRLATRVYLNLSLTIENTSEEEITS